MHSLQVPDKREIQTQYRGWDIKVKVSCISEQINVEMACVLQGLGVDAGTLDPLYCEADLIKGRPEVDANKVAPGCNESGLGTLVLFASTPALPLVRPQILNWCSLLL